MLILLHLYMYTHVQVHTYMYIHHTLLPYTHAPHMNIHTCIRMHTYILTYIPLHKLHFPHTNTHVYTTCITHSKTSHIPAHTLYTYKHISTEMHHASHTYTHTCRQNIIYPFKVNQLCFQQSGQAVIYEIIYPRGRNETMNLAGRMNE